MSLAEIEVHPTGWESSPACERFPVSLMGHIMPKVYVLIAEVFTLPEGIDKDPILKSMTAGLEYTLSQFPVLAGILQMDPESGRMWVTRNKGSTVSLHIKHMLDDDFPSYAELEKNDV